MDTYNGCEYNCAYCFSSCRNQNFKDRPPKPTKFSIIRRYFQRAFENKKKSKNAIVQSLRQRLPIHFGGMSDPFQPIENQEKISLKTLELLNKYDYPVVISTKSDLLIRDDYLGLLKEMKKVAVQISLISSDNSVVKKFEPSLPKIERRLKMLEILSKNKIWTACRLQPIIPKINDKDFRLIDILAQINCKHIMIEHLKLPTYSTIKWRNRLSKACSYDIYEYYRNFLNGSPRGMFFEIPPSQKIMNLKPLIKKIHLQNMTFGAADNDLHDLGDDYCCCGVRKIQGFNDVFSHNNTKAIWDGKKSGKIQYVTIEKNWVPSGSIRMMVNRKSRLTNYEGNSPSSVSDFMQIKWNSPNTNNAPTDMVNVVSTSKRDVNGNIIYKYSKKLTI